MPAVWRCCDSCTCTLVGLAANGRGRNFHRPAVRPLFAASACVLLLSCHVSMHGSCHVSMCRALVARSVHCNPEKLVSLVGENLSLWHNCRDIQAAAADAMLVLAAMQPLNAITFVGDGIFQGAADFRYLAVSMAVACSAGAGSMLLAGDTLQSVWLSLLLLQLFRALAIGARYEDALPVFGGSPLKEP